MESSTQKTYKRQDRSVSPETALKISNSLKSYNATHPRDPQWCKRISDSLRTDKGGYWSKIPAKPKDDGEGNSLGPQKGGRLLTWRWKGKCWQGLRETLGHREES